MLSLHSLKHGIKPLPPKIGHTNAWRRYEKGPEEEAGIPNNSFLSHLRWGANILFERSVGFPHAHKPRHIKSGWRGL